MSIKNIAKQIPDKIRSQILLTEDDIIEKAVPVWENERMQKLLKIWHTFIEPHKELVQCPICVGNILTNFKQMKSALIDLEKDYQLLEALK